MGHCSRNTICTFFYVFLSHFVPKPNDTLNIVEPDQIKRFVL